MVQQTNFESQPWDSRALGIECYRVNTVSEAVLKEALSSPGHYTVRVEPLSRHKRLLHEHGFYYCDTLIEPYCDARQLTLFFSDDISIAQTRSIERVVGLVRNGFQYDRFHRDFFVDGTSADLRYEAWLRQLEATGGTILEFLYRGDLAGFFAYEGNKVCLHTLSGEYRGRGLSRYFWSSALSRMVREGHGKISSSISAANLAVVNLYRSLGFRFRNPQDIYHRVVRPVSESP